MIFISLKYNNKQSFKLPEERGYLTSIWKEYNCFTGNNMFILG